MPCPVTANLQVSMEGDSNTLYQADQVTLCTADGQVCGRWDPLAQGNAGGRCDGSNVTYRVGLFANGIPAVQGNGGGGRLLSISALGAMTDFDLTLVFRPITPAVNFERMIDGPITTGWGVLRQGMNANTWGVTVIFGAGGANNGIYLTVTDDAVHVLHVQRTVSGGVGTVVLEFDGHTNAVVTGGLSGSATLANQFSLLSDGTSSGTNGAISTLYVHTKPGGLNPTEVNSILTYVAAPGRYNLALGGMPSTGYKGIGGSLGPLSPLHGIR